MNTELMAKAQKAFMKDIPNVNVGDTVEVHLIIRDGDKKRIQKFKGLVIAIKGMGINKTFTVRKISYGIGVEKILPFHSTNIEKIVVLKHSSVKRSKLYFLRKRIGKAAMKLKAGNEIVPEENMISEEEQETAVIDTPEAKEVEAEVTAEEQKS